MAKARVRSRKSANAVPAVAIPQIENDEVAVADLIPYAKNSRVHSERQIEALTKSIKEFGFTNPVLVWKDNQIIGGHARVIAAQRVGLETVPVRRCDHLTDMQRRMLVIADNKLAQVDFKWDDAVLEEELRALHSANFDFSIAGFLSSELPDFTDLSEQARTDEDAVPELPEKVRSKVGDIYILGEHRLMCGDSTNTDDVGTLMDGVKADMVFTDPPYNANYSSRVDVNKRKPWGGIKNDNMPTGEFTGFLLDTCSALYMNMKDKASVYCCIDWKHYPQLAEVFGDAFTHKATVIWDKKHFALGTYYRTQYEMVLFGIKGEKVGTWNSGRNERDVWSMSREATSSYVHPTQKPVELVERALKNSSNENDAVLDLFGGSGTTLIACEKLKRKAHLMELDPRYVDVIVKRWEQFTGKKAQRLKNKKK